MENESLRNAASARSSLADTIHAPRIKRPPPGHGRSNGSTHPQHAAAPTYMGDAMFATLIQAIKTDDANAIEKQRLVFQAAHGPIVAAYICATIAAGVAYTGSSRGRKKAKGAGGPTDSRQVHQSLAQPQGSEHGNAAGIGVGDTGVAHGPKAARLHIHFPWHSANDKNLDSVQMLARCEQLSIRLATTAGRQKGDFLRSSMYVLFTCAERLLGMMETDGSVLCNEGRAAALRSVQADLERVGSACQRLEGENGQMRYISGVLWGVVPLFSVCLCVVLGTYLWPYLSARAGFDASGSSNFWQYVGAHTAAYETSYWYLFIAILVLIAMSTPVFWWSNRQFGDRFNPNQRPSVDEDAAPWRENCVTWIVFELLAVALPTVIGFVYPADTVLPLIISLFAGGLGATISVIWRTLSGKLMLDPTLTPQFLRLRGAFRFIIGATFGTILFILLQLKIISIPGLPVDSVPGLADGGMKATSQNTYYLP